MKLTPENLRDFLSILPHYEPLPLAARRGLASIERPAQSCSALVLGNSLQVLIDAGFLLPPSPNGRCAIAPTRQEFIRVLRVLRSHPVFHTSGPTTFSGYLDGLLDVDERGALRNDSTVGYADRNLVLFRQVTAPDWVEDFLNAKSGEWELPYVTPGTSTLFASAEVLSAAQAIVQWLMAHGGHVALRDLPALASDPEVLSAALHAGLRYALLFAALAPDTMDALIGVWPGITAHVALADVPPPRNVAPTKTFAPCFLVEDMTALLVACGTEPLRLRANDSQLFAKTVRELAATLHPLPKWVEEDFGMEPETRLHTTVSYVRTFGLVEEKGHPPEHMAVSARGREWLGLPMGDRLRVLMDGVLDRKQTVAAFRDFEGAQIGSAGSWLYVSTTMKPPPDIPAAIMQPFRSLQGDGFFPLEEIVAFSRTANPLLEIFRKDKAAYFAIDSRYLNYPDTEQLQKLWSDTVRHFVRVRLLPLGGVRVGRGKEGLSIALTPAGRYFLGQANHWQWSATADSQVIVQPNFEVTFLGESPAAEAEMGRFAERRGRQMGALFQITKKSIFAAAAAGMTAQAVLEILERVCTREVPGNVRREIQGWFTQCRKVSFESVMLIRCPDHETALRIIGLAKGSAVALTDTVLEYQDPGKQRPGLIKKLKEMGVLVSVQEKAAPAPERRPQRRWGRW
ncbi:MAG: helicase-associated domain-containing protein [Acidobacteriia bacterium]|nr:helicase-associated domain-containing protein [Terriglobia bacterium]